LASSTWPGDASDTACSLRTKGLSAVHAAALPPDGTDKLALWWRHARAGHHTRQRDLCRIKWLVGARSPHPCGV